LDLGSVGSKLDVSDREVFRPELLMKAGSEEESTRIATLLAASLKAGDVVLLDGVLASGKTFLVRKMVEFLGTKDEISSPTYAIANIYQCKTCDVLHVDAYRLKNDHDFYNLGLELEVERSICLIEWGSRIQNAFGDFLKVSIALEPKKADERSLVMTAHGPRSLELLHDLKERYQKQ
jgi:tRNA threonylcarbamoyl adenosine modification protein YjeE